MASEEANLTIIPVAYRTIPRQSLRMSVQLSEPRKRNPGSPGPDPGSGGRPRTLIDVDAVRRAASLGCTYEELAVIIGIGKTQFYEHLDRNPEIRQAIDEGRAAGRTTLRRQQWQRAEAGSDTMLIWLGKQLLGQKDKIDADVTIGPSDSLNHLFAARTVEALANRGNTTEPPTIDGKAEAVADETKPAKPLNIFEPAAE